MKAVLIIFNQALTEKAEYLLDHLNIKGFTLWPIVYGRGSDTGRPHMGTHTWPETNSGILTIVNESIVDTLLEKVKIINEINTDVGIRAFVWDIEKTI